MQQLCLQSVPDIATGDVFAFLACEWRRVWLEHHADCGFIHGQWSHGFHGCRIAQGVRNIQLVDACNTDNIACLRKICLNTLKTMKPKHL